MTGPRAADATVRRWAKGDVVDDRATHPLWFDATRIVMLLPATRTEQQWWQLMVEPFRDRPGSPMTVEFLPGRMHFLRPGQTAIARGERPPFGCCLLIWRPTPTDLVYDAATVRGGLFG